MRPFDDAYRSKVLWALTIAALIGGTLLIVPFIPAILWAIVLSVLAYPMYERAKKRFKNASAGAAFATFGTMAMIGIPLVLVGAALFVQINGFVRELHNTAPAGQSLDMTYFAAEIDKSITPITKSLSPNFSFSQWFEQNREQLLAGIRAPLGKAIYSIGYTLFTLVVAFLTMFFMLRDGHKMLQPALELIPLPHDKTKAILDRIGKTIRAVFVGVVLVALIQGTAAGIAYAIAGVPNALMWGVATIILCTIPLLGAPIIYIPMALILAAQGKPIHAVALAAFGFIVVSNIDNLLRPFIIGQQVELHPMAIFFSLLGGVLLFGPVGIMAGPMILTVLLALQDILREMRGNSFIEEEHAQAQT